MSKRKNNLGKAPTTFRGTLATGLTESSEISLEGGQFGAGFIKGFAVITHGEALGHNMWIDAEFVASVAKSLKTAEVKSRYTHPDMSSDGLAKGLGMVNFAGGSEDISRGDLHFFKSAHRSPDGNLAEHVAIRAEEAPNSFGSSISFKRDRDAEDEFVEAHLEDYEYTDRWGDVHKGQRFKSPDPLNEHNYTHARLGELRAVDIVDDPAANPDGLFCRDSVFKDAEALIGFALGETSEAPELQNFDVNPERFASFIDRYLTRKGLSIMPVKKKTPKLGNDKTDPKKNAKLGEGSETEGSEEGSEGDGAGDGGNTDEGESGDGESSRDGDGGNADEGNGSGDEGNSTDAGRKELSRFMTDFGTENGAKWWAEGIDYSTAQKRHNEALKAENDLLRKKLKSAESGEGEAVSSGSEGSDRVGYSSNIKMAGDGES